MLKTGTYPTDTVDLEYSSKRDIKKTAEILIARLFGADLVEHDAVEPERSTNFNIDSGMDQYMKSCLKRPKSSLDKEFSLLESTKTRTTPLENLLLALMSLKPTSTVCEQAFSTASSFKTKSRNRMSPEKLNILVWLKYYFKSKK